MQLRSISKKEQVSRWREIIEIRKKCCEKECYCKYKRTSLYCIPYTSTTGSTPSSESSPDGWIGRYDAAIGLSNFFFLSRWNTRIGIWDRGSWKVLRRFRMKTVSFCGCCVLFTVFGIMFCFFLLISYPRACFPACFLTHVATFDACVKSRHIFSTKTVKKKYDDIKKICQKASKNVLRFDCQHIFLMSGYFFDFLIFRGWSNPQKYDCFLSSKCQHIFFSVKCRHIQCRHISGQKCYDIGCDDEKWQKKGNRPLFIYLSVISLDRLESLFGIPNLS